MIERRSGELAYYVFGGLVEQPGLIHAISGRHGGISPAPYDTLNLSLTVGDDPELVCANRRLFAEAVGADTECVYTARQVHGADVWYVRDGDEQPREADIMMTDVPGVFLSQRFADCVPLLLWDTEHAAVAAAHAGWRGTLLGVAGATVRAMADRFGTRPDLLRAAIGPSIGPCCYEVGLEVADAFAAFPDCVVPRSAGKAMLDLWELNRRGFVESGLSDEQVEVSRVCTRCHNEVFFSHRANGYPAGRFGSLIGVAL